MYHNDTFLVFEIVSLLCFRFGGFVTTAIQIYTKSVSLLCFYCLVAMVRNSPIHFSVRKLYRWGCPDHVWIRQMMPLFGLYACGQTVSSLGTMWLDPSGRCVSRGSENPGVQWAMQGWRGTVWPRMALC